MSGAIFAIVVNIAVAGLFAASFAIIAFTNPSHRAVYGFGLSYLIGMMTPLSELLLPFSGWPAPFMLTSYFCFLTGFLVMAGALARFEGAPVPWRALAAIFGAAIVTRWITWDGVRDQLPHELAFQAPFVAVSLLLAWLLWRSSRGRVLNIAATVTFGLVALHFLAKPFLAHGFGSGATVVDYIGSTYALLSQASSAILLTAAGLLLLLVVVQSIVEESRRASEIDALSGLANRRGFDLRAAQVLARTAQLKLPVAVAMFDIDHFKAINDAHGHSAGDDVIRAFAELLRDAAPHAAVIGRVGGEEFALLFQPADEEIGRLNAEAIRIATQSAGRGLTAFTVSGGVAAVLATETLSAAMRRADAALYEAKRQGRNRICVATGAARSDDSRQRAS